ncbi:Translocon-associated protein subunit gamma [Holothuria leucospilota]|uniref:Translocon-associated protein subunit gamma n=1 Tax=Holothuria leucospilota TaxID=206669 RepID=A0A9Q0YFA1_HOLLE|nr:Translocon-associated protein subunit gamma [Holothuria leucospilota]
MPSQGGKKFTREEELLLQDFSRNMSTKSSALFYGNALIVAALPAWVFWRIHQLDITQTQTIVLFAAVTILSTWLVAFAYRNVKFSLRHKIAQKREDAVSKEVIRKLTDAEQKKMSRKEKDERILWKKNEVADHEATTFSIFYNNTLFILIVLVASFLILHSFDANVNYALSILGGAGLLALLSTGSK